jgi:transposase-like protein
MTDYNTKLMEVLLSGGNVDEIIRQEIETAINGLLETEITAFLGYERYSVEGYNSGDSRNGSYTRTIHSRFGDLQVKVPRDRNGEFRPQTVPSYKQSTDSLEEMVIHLYRNGITTAEIADLIEKMYGHHYSRGAISNMAANIQTEVEAFHKRPLEKRYVVVYADATYISVRRDCVDKEALHVLLGITPEGKKEILSYALYPTEGADNYREMLTNIKSRGAEQVLLFVSDGLTGFRDACKSVYPQADHQSCWVHISRSVMKLIRVKDRREILDDLKTVYGAENAEQAEAALDAFCEKHGKRYPKLAEKFSDRRSLFSFYSYPQEIRQSLYTTNLVENMNKQLKRKTKRKEQFPNEEALDRCAYCHYSAQNARFATKAHRGFGQCQYELEKLFEERFLTSTPSGTSAA